MPFAAAKEAHVSPACAWAYLAQGDAIPDCVGEGDAISDCVGDGVELGVLSAVMTGTLVLVQATLATTVDMTLETTVDMMVESGVGPVGEESMFVETTVDMARAVELSPPPPPFMASTQ